MIKTKITFKEIKPGDLIEVVAKEDGVKSVETGIAFEPSDDYISGYGAWFTSEGGLLVIEDSAQTIWRIDVTEATFDDIRATDLIRVATTRGQHTQVVEVAAGERIDNGVDVYWTSAFGGVLAWKDPSYEQKIEILERTPWGA